MLQKEGVEHLPQVDFLDRMAERFGATANAATIFGAPIERDEITVIPVAKVAYGFGGGRGQGSGGDGSGGGAAYASPQWVISKCEMGAQPINRFAIGLN